MYTYICIFYFYRKRQDQKGLKKTLDFAALFAIRCVVFMLEGVENWGRNEKKKKKKGERALRGVARCRSPSKEQFRNYDQ